MDEHEAGGILLGTKFIDCFELDTAWILAVLQIQP